MGNGKTLILQKNTIKELTKEAKLAFDVEYVQKVSLLFDLKIIFLTFFSVFGGANIYEKKYSESEQIRKQKN